MFPLPLPAALRQRQPERPILPWESLENLGIKHWKTLEFRGMTCGSTATERQMYVIHLWITSKHVAGRKRIHLNAWNADFVPCTVSKQGTSICHLLLPDAWVTSGNNCS